MHVLAVRCDLETGKSLNIAPPGWRRTLGRLRDGFNHEHGWSRPDDPARARAQQPGHRAYIDAVNLPAGLAVDADPRELLRDYLVQRVEHGVVRGRADVVRDSEGCRPRRAAARQELSDRQRTNPATAPSARRPFWKSAVGRRRPTLAEAREDLEPTADGFDPGLYGPGSRTNAVAGDRAGAHHERRNSDIDSLEGAAGDGTRSTP